jgi:hypothetical protein
MCEKNRMVRFGAWLTVGAIAGLAGCSAGGDVPARDQVAGAPAADPSVPNSQVTAPRPVASAASRPGAPLPQANVQLRGAPGRRVYGVMATGKTPDEAAESFRQKSAAELGVGADELAPARINGAATLRNARTLGANGVGLMYDPVTGKPKFRLYSYDQMRAGIPVFRAGLRTLVREEGANPVVWANSELRPLGNFATTPVLAAHSVDVDKSLRALKTQSDALGQPSPTALVKVSSSTPTIFAGVGDQDAAPRMGMRYTAQAPDGPGKWTFVADAETGEILHIESNVHFDVSGTVKAKVITGGESAECGTFGIAPLPYANIGSAYGNVVADKMGVFTIPQTGTTSFPLVSTVSGKYFRIDDEGGSNYIKTWVTPPAAASVLHEDTTAPPERVLAQLNAYKALNDLRDQLLSYVPNFPVIATQTDFPIHVNVADVANCDAHGAWYDNESEVRSISFCPRNAEHANTAFRSIVHHEYGHHIVDSAGSGQVEYGEGMADTIAMLFAKDPRIGVGYHLNQCSSPLRQANRLCKYDAALCTTCGGGAYECGSVLSGTVWDIWQQLDQTVPASSADIIRKLVFSSVLLHTGTKINSSIAVDMLTLDDNDGLLENGTPHYSAICAGFTAHGMTCPPIVSGLVIKGVDLNSEGLSAGPFAPTSTTYTLYNLGPQQNLSFTVALPAGASWLTASKTSGTIALGQSTTVTLSINQAQAKLLADGRYTAAVQFVNATTGVGTATRQEKLRVGAPVPIYTANFSDGPQGFTSDGLDANLWHRSTTCADPLAGHSIGGSLYYGKDSGCNYATGIPNSHAMNSPEITIANPQTAELGFKYLLKTEDSPTSDTASVLISVNGGAFMLAASNNEPAAGQKLKEGVWQELRFDIAKFLPATGPTKIKVRFAFNASDPYANLTMGFAVDDVIIYAQPQTTSQRPCAGYCMNPTAFNGAAAYQSGNLGTAATCHESTVPIRGGNCGNFVSPRNLFVNGVAMNCNWANWSALPPAKNGGHCVYTTSGNNAWAAFNTW